MAPLIKTTTYSLKGFWGLGPWGFGQPLPPTSRNSHGGQPKLAVLGCMVSPLPAWFLLVVAWAMIIFIWASLLIIIKSYRNGGDDCHIERGDLRDPSAPLALEV